MDEKEKQIVLPVDVMTFSAKMMQMKTVAGLVSWAVSEGIVQVISEGNLAAPLELGLKVGAVALAIIATDVLGFKSFKSTVRKHNPELE